ncbi:MAG TPA: PKD domain-containing protein [Chitinophagaceae bacterium]
MSAQLSAGFTSSTVSGCAPILVQFTDQSAGRPTQWKWDLGNGVTSYLQNPSTTYFNPGTYSVKLVVRTASGADSVVKSSLITVFPNPKPDFVAMDTMGCYPFPVLLSDKSTTASGTITSWSWDLGDGTLSSDASPFHTYTAGGSYTVTLKVTNSFGCAKTASKAQYIKVAPGVKSSFTNNSPNVCSVPATIDFTNTSTGPGLLTYSWDFGDGTTSNDPNPSHTYTTAGSYTVKLVTASSQGCTDTLVKTSWISVGTTKSDFTTTASLCAGVPIVFNNTTAPAPASSLWYFSDGTTSDAMNPVKTFAKDGVYIVKLVNNFGTCSDSVTRSITVAKRPVLSFVASQTTSCKAPLTVSFANGTSGAISWHWDFGDGTTSTHMQPTHTYTQLGNYTVTLIATNANGCSDTLVKRDYIKIQKPGITINHLPRTGCTPLTINPTATVQAAEAVTGYRWNFGDGTFSTEAAPAHTYTKAGTYNVTLTITTASGCSDSLVLNDAVRVGDKPKADFTVSPAEVCADYPMNFTDKSTGKVDQWLWLFGDNQSSTEQHPTHIFDGIGKFSTTLVVWSNTCPDTITIKDVVNVKPPLSGFAVSNSCEAKYTKSFTDKSVKATSFLYDFGDGTTSTEPNPTHTYKAPGTYKVWQTVSNDTCSHSNWIMVQVVDEKSLFVPSKQVLCKGEVLTLTTPSINAANIASWQWNFGDGTTSADVSTVSHSYTKAGTYTVLLTITDVLGCVDTRSAEITVYGPTAAFNQEKEGVCLGATIKVSDASATDGTNNLVKWVWSYGDGALDSTGAVPAPYLYKAAGEYTVSLHVVDAYGCADVITKNNTIIIADPKAAFSSPDSLSCTGKPVQFVNQSIGYDLQYAWRFGDGTGATDASPVHHYGAIGLYTVGLKVTDRFGCTASQEKPSYINISLPKASFTVSDSISSCPPLLVAFTNTSSNYVSLAWDFGDGNTSVLANPSHYYTIPGIYFARLVATGPGGCTDSFTQRIEVKGPRGEFSYEPTTGCKPLTVSFRATTTNSVSFVWDFSDGTTLSTKDSVVSHTYTTAGEFVPKMILVDGTGCTVSIVGKDTIKVVGITSTFTLDQDKLCNAGAVAFTNTTVANDVIAGYQWSFGDGTTSTEQHPVHRYSKPGTYTVQLLATTESGCTDTYIMKEAITVFEGPQVEVRGDDQACMPATLSFSGSILKGNVTTLAWDWSFGNGQKAIGQNPAAQVFANDGTYAVTAVARDTHGCSDTASKSITIHPLPSTHAGADALVCRGSTTKLSASGAATYTWKASADLSCTTCPAPVASPTVTATYYVTGATAFGCTTTDSVKITVRQPFTLSTAPGDTICAGEVTALAASGADRYTWYPSSGLDNAGSGKTKARPMATTLYTVVARDSDNCFTDSARVLIKVNPMPTVEAGSDVTASAGSAVQLRAAASSDVTSWEWMPSQGLNCATCPEPVASPRSTTKYNVRVRNDGGCAGSDDVTVSVVCNGGNLFIPNTFSPNGDGSNERFYPRGTGIHLIKSLRVFNRWGEVVFERLNFNANDATAGWDGTYKGARLSPDVFIYSCEVVCINNEVIPFKGDITLLR